MGLFTELKLITKICNKCKIDKPLNEFGLDNSTLDKKNYRGILCSRCNLTVGYLELIDTKKLFAYAKMYGVEI
jgi:hypothetical protein